jgi:hypothetical protein
MMPTMTREQFEEMSFEELLEWAYDNIDDNRCPNEGGNSIER